MMVGNRENKNHVKKLNLSETQRIYKEKITNHFDEIAYSRSSWIKRSSGFYEEDIKMMKEFVPAKSRVLEIGSGNGHLLASLKPETPTPIKRNSIPSFNSCLNSFFDDLNMRSGSSVKDLNVS